MDNVTSNNSMEEHMSRVTEAIHKINSDEILNETDIKEVLKSLMNGQIFISEKNEMIEHKIEEKIKNINARIEKLEDFIFMKL